MRDGMPRDDMRMLYRTSRILIGITHRSYDLQIWDSGNAPYDSLAPLGDVQKCTL